MVQSQSAKEKMQSHAVEEKEQKEQKDTKKNNTEKKTKLKKSMEVLSRSFRQAAEREAEGFVKMKEMRHKREIDYQLKMKELDNERRREERKCELAIFQFLAQTWIPQQQQREFGFPTSAFYGNPYQGASGIPYGHSPSRTSNTNSSYEEEGKECFAL